MSTHWDPDFLEEVQAEESPLDPAYPFRGKPLGPARVAGRLVRYALEGPKELGRVWDRAVQGKATLMDSITGTMAAINPSFGGGFGAGPRMKAAPWQSRTLDTILGQGQRKVPESASPDRWMSILKGSGLPKEELDKVSSVMPMLDPKSKVSGSQLAAVLEHPKYLPTLGVTRTELGGPKWEAMQKRLNDLNITHTDIQQRMIQRESALKDILIKENPTIKEAEFGNVFRSMKRVDPEYQKIIAERNKLIGEHAKLSQQSVGKRPHWSESYHNIEELKSPREVLYHAPPKEVWRGEYSNHDMRLHYPGKDKNLLFHQREGILEFPDGKKSTHISEQQSDWISEFEKSSKGVGDILSFKASDGTVYTGQKPIIIRDEHRGKFRITNENGIWLDDTLFDNLSEAKKFIKENSIIKDVPEPPMKDNWWKMGLKDAVKRAVEAGHDYLTWDTPETIIKRGGEKIRGVAENHYGNNVPGFLKKEYGVETKRVPVGKTEGRVVDLLSDRGETVNRPVEALSIYRVPAEEAPLPTLRWVVGDPDFGTYAHYGSLREAENMLNQLLEYRRKDREVLKIPITEEMQRKVFLEGQFFSKQTARPGGRNAESAA